MKNCKIARVFGTPTDEVLAILKGYDYFYIAYDGTCYDQDSMPIMIDEQSPIMLSPQQVDLCVPCTIQSATTRRHVVMAQEDDWETSAFVVGVYETLEKAKEVILSKFADVKEAQSSENYFIKHNISEKPESSIALTGKLKSIPGVLMISGRKYFIGILSYK